MNQETRRVIRIGSLARVEGEGALYVRMRGSRVVEVRLNIFEPPRLFEALLVGRHFSEVADITARICGICPAAYQMSSVHAVERALAVRIDPGVRLLRRLLYCGEWLESHALHVYMLHAPDFLGYDDAFAMARAQRPALERGLRLKKTGNRLMALLGGREVHPVSVRPGGFYRVPHPSELRGLEEDLKWALEAALETARWVAGFPFPAFEQDYEFVALAHPEEYPLNEGRIVSSRGLNIDAEDFDLHFTEQQVKHSTALHCVLRQRGSYLVGPLARIHLNYNRLPEIARQAARDCRLRPDCRNPFLSILARSIEMVFACEEALRIVRVYEPPPQPCAPLPRQSGTGHAATEAPRGLLYHRYDIGPQGLIRSARIVPPTSQNQKRIEDDLRALLPELAREPPEQMAWRCEQAVRNYDPCISCATHFLRLQLEREP
jgi:coenzyme F420-reducing hydrogenase alpha subunit